jgi:DNA-directed RNA polymerase specialized sigma24 family protein
VTLVDDVLDRAFADGPARRLDMLKRLSQLLDEATEVAVLDAYRYGLSTAKIAALLDIPRSTAYVRFSHLIPPNSRRRPGPPPSSSPS